VRFFLLPLHATHCNPNMFLHRVSLAESLKDLYEAIESETSAQFDALSQHYVFYMPDSLSF
jgi:hypothetical protein